MGDLNLDSKVFTGLVFVMIMVGATIGFLFEQAASIEQTPSSLEEMASMTRQNADNATQADTLMKEANQMVSSTYASMGELTQSMQEISRASEETSKIIKTIDEIACQTNLLALNAAVEASKNTASLIEGTVKKFNGGGHGLESQGHSGAKPKVKLIRETLQLPRKKAGSRTFPAAAHHGLAAFRDPGKVIPWTMGNSMTCRQV
jgi:hypothetical protein